MHFLYNDHNKLESAEKNYESFFSHKSTFQNASALFSEVKTSTNEHMYNITRSRLM